MKSFFRIVLIVILSIAIALAAFEVILRTTHFFKASVAWSQPDPILRYRFTPNANFWFFQENDHPITGKINKYGWRDKNWTIEKPKDTVRVAVLGDSFVAAFQVESDRTFLELAQNKLNASQGKKFEFMNFGIIGATQSEELLILKNDVIKFSPDIVICFFFPVNDISDIDKDTAVEKNRVFYSISKAGELVLDSSFVNSKSYKMKERISWLRQHSALVTLIAKRYNDYQVKMWDKIKPKSPLAIGDYLSLCTAHPDPKLLENYKLNKAIMKEMAKISKSRNIKFVLATILPAKCYINAEEQKYVKKDPNFNWKFFEEDMRQFAKSEDIGYIELAERFRKEYERTKVSLNWGTDDWHHWNYPGNQLVAEILAEEFRNILY